jgi:DNA helicase-2/ATP-dependent DNA helicase PcrA
MDGKRLVLNYHQIDDYLICPAKFKYVHIIGVPVPHKQAMIYGTAMHGAIEHYFRHKKSTGSVEVEDLVRIFVEAWDSRGFISRDHEEKRFLEGKKIIREFYDKQEADPDIPTRIEEPFRVSLDLGEDSMILKGRFDAVYDRKGKIEIRDFKTGGIRDQKSADKRLRDTTQLLAYALAHQAKYGTLPTLSLYFVESGILAKYIPTEKALEGFKVKILKAVEGIRAGNFEPSNNSRSCDLCPTHGLYVE